MAVAEDGNSRLNLKQAFFRRGKVQTAREEEICQRLPVRAAKQTASPKWFPGLRRPHTIILNRNNPRGEET
jgi:hypothetical protein